MLVLGAEVLISHTLTALPSRKNRACSTPRKICTEGCYKARMYEAPFAVAGKGETDVANGDCNKTRCHSGKLSQAFVGYEQ